MATKIYDYGIVELVDGTELYITPLKIKYMREFMDKFEEVTRAGSDDDAIDGLLKCTLVAMKQYCPRIKTIEQLEDEINLPAIYQILDYSAGIKVDTKKEESVKTQAVESGATWDDLDLATLEAEVFLLGIWKDYEDLETSLSMPELTKTLNSKRELDYQEKKFLAGIQGVDLDKQTGKDKENAWEKMKAKVFGGVSSDPNDITSYQGLNAQKAGFGIGMGLSYEKID